MIDVKKAKVKLLSQAFQGALVDYSNKEKANHALSAIHSKRKGFDPVQVEEQLIVTPSYWNWSRLGYVTQNHGQKVPETDFCYIDVGTLDNIHQRLPEKENLVNAKDAPSRARKIVQLGDVLYSTVRPYLHNICIIDKVFSRTPIASTAFCVMEANEEVLVNKFLYYWLLTPEFDKYSNGDPSKGALYPAIGEKDLLRGVIPLPSVDEQQLIVEKIEQTFSILDTIDELQKEYADNMAVLKSKLVDLAIQGKLTEQLPEDGTAEELYQQIQAEKQVLIKAGKIKKEKDLPVIAKEEIPFEIPDNWKWVRLGDFGSWHAGATPSRGNSSYYDGSIPWLKTGDLNDGLITRVSEHITELALKECSVQLNPVGSVLIAMYGATIGKLGIAQIPLTTNQACCACAPYKGIYNRYLFYLLMSMRKTFIDMGIGGAQSNISREKIVSTIVPLPPLAEQKRIVERLDKLLAVCDRLN